MKEETKKIVPNMNYEYTEPFRSQYFRAYVGKFGPWKDEKRKYVEKAIERREGKLKW